MASHQSGEIDFLAVEHHCLLINNKLYYLMTRGIDCQFDTITVTPASQPASEYLA